jgi:hypothetical protein
MDDLIGGMLMLTAVCAIIALAIAVAVAMAGLGAAVGSVLVGLRGTGVFIGDFAQRVRSRGAADRQPVAPEPAFQLYALGQLRADVRRSGELAWDAMQDARRLTSTFAAKCDGAWMPLGVGALIGGVLGTGVGAVITGVLTLPIFLVSGVVMAGAWLMIGTLRLAEAARRRVRRTSYECPVDHDRFPLPVYVCPACGAEHRRLVPGRWGVFKRECQCGRVALPTMVLNGRQRVPQRCPSGHDLAGIIGYAEIIRLALVAGPSAGKTTFLAGALLEFEQLSAGGTLALNVVDQSRAEYDAALKTLREGRLPDKTQATRNPALVAEVQGGGRSRVLTLYDVAGEAYAGDEAIIDLRFLEVPTGLVMLVDPFALERFAVDHAEEIASARAQLGPSTVSPMRVLERTLGALAAAGSKTESLPLAVVVGKTDALSIGAQIEALRPTAGDRAVPQWLEANGGGPLVRAIEDAFGTVGWFHASALGRTPDPANRQAFVPAGTAAPLLWLLERKGVVPASAPFKPAQAAGRLSGASAADFAPIGRLGWVLRAAPSAVLTAAVITAVGAGVASGVKRIVPATGDRAVTSDRAEVVSRTEVAGVSAASRPSRRTFERAAFTVALPRSWKVTARNDRQPGYVSNRWRSANSRRTTIRVDYTRNVRATAGASARALRHLVSRSSGYREFSFRRVKLGERRAWRWEFQLDGLRKVDYFFNACGTGYAVLGATTPKQWTAYKKTFSRAARSVEPKC